MTPVNGINTSDLLVAAMKVCREKHRVISSNIANVDTPNYNPVELDFKKALGSFIEGRERVSLRKTQPAHIDRALMRPSGIKVALSSKNDFNKVDLEDQVTKLSDNTGQFIVYSSLLNKQFEQVKNLIATIR